MFLRRQAYGKLLMKLSKIELFLLHLIFNEDNLT